jgi:thiamine kinase-like enzyme
VRFPRLAPQLLKAIGIFITCSPQMLKRKHHLVHRDLTLSNILLAKNGEIQIIDFGLAIFADRMFEIASVVEDMQWFENISKEFYKTKMMEETLSDKKLFKLYRMFSLHTSVYALSISSRRSFGLAYSYFKHILNLKR